jgi:hypothetical protein
MCPAMVLKYTSSRSGSTGSQPAPGAVSPYTCTTVRPARSRVEITACVRSVSASAPRSITRRQMRPRIRSMAGSGSASSRISPRSMMAMRVHSSDTSSTMCVERMTALFSPSSLSRFRKRTRSAGSSPAVGSSTISSRGLPSSATATPKRCRMPPEYPPSFCLRTSHRLVCRSSASTTSLRARRSPMPLSRAKWLSRSSALDFGYTPNSCGR